MILLILEMQHLVHIKTKRSKRNKKNSIKFVAYTFGYFESDRILKTIRFFKSLEKWGFKVNEHNKVLKNINDIS